MKFVICVSRGELQVHRLGCKDIWLCQDSWETEGESPRDAIRNELAELHAQGQDYTERDFRIMPCVKAITH